MRKGAHLADPYNKRYLKMYHALNKLGFASTFDLQRETDDMAPATTLGEMRLVGFPISEAQYVGRANGRKIYCYELTI